MMPDPSSSFEEEVLRGFAHDLVANPTARVALAYDDGTNPDPNYVYPEGVIAIVLDVWPEGPDGVVTLTDYTVSDDPSLSDSVIGVQVTIRHRDRLVVKAIVSDLVDVFHGRQAGMLGTVTLVSSLRSSGTSVGQDSNERQGRTENYYLTVHRPTANRL